MDGYVGPPHVHLHVRDALLLFLGGLVVVAKGAPAQDGDGGLLNSIMHSQGADHAWSPTECSQEARFDYAGDDLSKVLHHETVTTDKLIADSAKDCAKKCIVEPECYYYTYKPMTEHCYLKGPGAGYSKTASEEYITGNCTDVVAVAAMDATVDKDDRVPYNYVEGDVEAMRQPCVRAKATSLVYHGTGSISPSYPNAAAGIKVTSVDICAELCDSDNACKAWSAKSSQSKVWSCYLLTAWHTTKESPDSVSGTKCKLFTPSKVGACGCKLAAVNRSIPMTTMSVIVPGSRSESTQTDPSGNEMALAEMIWASLFFDSCPLCPSLSAPVEGSEGINLPNPDSVASAIKNAYREGKSGPSAQPVPITPVRWLRDFPQSKPDSSEWTYTEEVTWSRLPWWAASGSIDPESYDRGSDAFVIWRVANIIGMDDNVGGTGHRHHDDYGNRIDLGNPPSTPKETSPSLDVRTFDFKRLQHRSTCPEELSQLMGHLQIQVTKHGIDQGCLSAIRDHKLHGEVSQSVTSCQPIKPQKFPEKTKLAFMAYPKSGTTVFMIMVWTAIFYDACPTCPLTFPESDTHIKHSVSMNVLDWQLADTLPKQHWSDIERHVWEQLPLFTHALTGQWLKSVLPYEKWLNSLRLFFKDDDVQYRVASLYRERSKLTRSAHGYFGSENIKYFGFNWDGWIRGMLDLRKPNVFAKTFSFDRLVHCATCPTELRSVMDHYQLPLSQEAIERSCFDANARTLHPAVARKLGAMVHAKRNKSPVCSSL